MLLSTSPVSDFLAGGRSGATGEPKAARHFSQARSATAAPGTPVSGHLLVDDGPIQIKRPANPFEFCARLGGSFPRDLSTGLVVRSSQQSPECTCSEHLISLSLNEETLVRDSLFCHLLQSHACHQYVTMRHAHIVGLCRLATCM